MFLKTSTRRSSLGFPATQPASSGSPISPSGLGPISRWRIRIIRMRMVMRMMLLLHSTLCHLALILAHLVWVRYQGNWKSYCREEEENKYYDRDGCEHVHNDSMILINGVHDYSAKVIATCICLSLSAYVTLALQVGFIMSIG